MEGLVTQVSNACMPILSIVPVYRFSDSDGCQNIAKAIHQLAGYHAGYYCRLVLADGMLQQH